MPSVTPEFTLLLLLASNTVSHKRVAISKLEFCDSPLKSEIMSGWIKSSTLYLFKHGKSTFLLRFEDMNCSLHF